MSSSFLVVDEMKLGFRTEPHLTPEQFLRQLGVIITGVQEDFDLARSKAAQSGIPPDGPE